MDQTTFQGLLQTFQTQCSAENSIFDLSATAGNFGSPIVVLVHGIGGNFRHWFDPISMNPNDTWLFDINAHPPHSANGIGTSPPYQAGAAKSWTQYLSDNSITYINFSQAKPGDLLQFAVTELVAVLSSLEKLVFAPYEQDVAANGGTVPPLILLCHSRGGLVTRAALKQLGNAGVPHLRKVITLSTPHRGSYMPRLASDYNNFLHSQINLNIFGNNLPGPIQHFVDNAIEKHLNDLANMVREAMLHSFGSLSQSVGFDELIPGSAMLNNLVVDEQPLPGVQYYGFGGSQPTFVNMYICTMGQAIHLLATASPLLVTIIAKATKLEDTYDGLKELDQGDSAVALARSHWPDQFSAPHQDLKVNHMQALIDRPLQDAVLRIIQS
jgi:pimeloyl-ACP methyl ester carboxylesterase